MYHRLKSFIESCNILHDSQYGFREKRSTEHAINFRIEFNMDRKWYARGCSVTCKKPLTVNHSTLLKKIESLWSTCTHE